MQFGANEILTRQQLKNTVGGLKSHFYCMMVSEILN